MKGVNTVDSTDTPSTEVFIQILVKLVDRKLAPRAATVLRYVFVEKSCLDVHLYDKHMATLSE